jgi:8-oxo-dGTP pyrophosphatase MutT (NUDIX family)
MGALPFHELIATEVRGRIPVDAREHASVEEFLERFDQLASPFDEYADPVHVTASAIVVGERGVVLHRHKRLGLWLQPGGHIDPGESPWEAALREAGEETGLPVSWPERDGAQPLIHVDVHPGPRGHRHLDLRYLVHAADADPAPGADESQDVRWFPWDEAIEIADDGLRGILRVLAPPPA